MSASLSTTNDDIEKVDLLNNLSYEYYQIDVSKTFRYAKEALELSKRNNYPLGKSKALLNTAIAHHIQKNITSSVELAEQSLKLAQENNDVKLLAQAYNLLGVNYKMVDLNEKAVEYYMKSLELSKEINDVKMACFTYRNLGFLYDELGKEDKAIEYFLKGGEVARRSNHHMIEYISDLTLGNMAMRNDEFEDAIKFLERSYKKCSNKYSEVAVLLELSKVYEKQEKLTEAIVVSSQAVEIAISSGNKDITGNAQLDLSSLLFKNKNYKRCIEVANAAKQNITNNTNYTHKDIQLYQLLSSAYHESGNYKASSISYQKLTEIQDSVNLRDKLEIAAGLEAQYQIKEKEKENNLLKSQQKQNELILNQRKKTIFFTTSILFLISIIAILIFKAYRNKLEYNKDLQVQVSNQTKALQDANEQLKASNIELERFAYVASHDLKEPLRNISSFSGLLERKLKKQKEELQVFEYLNFIKSNVLQMNNLIVDILEFSRVGNISSEQLKETSFDEIINKVKQSMDADLKKQNASVNSPESTIKLTTIPSQIFLVFKNLISNGIKYNKNDSKTINIDYVEQERFHKFSVEDNGIGIDSQYQEYVFEMFKRLHNRQEYQGSGLGLSICKKIINNLGGDIWVENSELGSKFHFTIPKN